MAGITLKGIILDDVVGSTISGNTIKWSPPPMGFNAFDQSQLAAVNREASRYARQAEVTVQANLALREQLKSVEERADAWAHQAVECQKNAENAAETLRMLLEAMAGLHDMLRSLEWRKRRVDREEYCPDCENLKSTFGGNHAPTCRLSGALSLTAPGKWKLMRRPAQKPSPREA